MNLFCSSSAAEDELWRNAVQYQAGGVRDQQEPDFTTEIQEETLPKKVISLKITATGQ